MLDGQILNWGGDRVDMANAVESRPVFLDHQLAAVAARVPPEYRIRDGKEKWVLREALRFAMPPFLYERRKFAFMAPPAHRSSGRAGPFARWLIAISPSGRSRESGSAIRDGRAASSSP